MSKTTKSSVSAGETTPKKPASKPVAKVAGQNRKQSILGAAIILMVTLLAYLPARQASFIWDDNILLTENAHMRSADGLAKIWFSTEPHDYFPLTLTSLWLEWRLWGTKPAGYLFINAFLHALGCVVLWRVLKRLSIPASWLIALLLALHPVAASSIAWLSERKNTLSWLFFALSVLSYLKSESPNGKRWYWFSLAAFLGALLSKTSVVMLPFVLLGCIWWQKTASHLTQATAAWTKRDWARVAPFFALSFILGLVTVWFQMHRAIGENAVDIPNEPMTVRLLGGSWGLWFYLAKAILPIHLSAIYPRWHINPASFLSYLPGLLWLGMLGVFWKFRAGWGRSFLFSLGYFTLTLLPILGFFRMSYLMHSRVADHWQYLALIGPLALLVGGGAHLLKQRFTIGSGGLGFFGAVLALVFFGLTFRQAQIRSVPETLWLETLKQNPKAWAAHNNLGRLYALSEQTAKAQFHFGEAVRLKPDSPQTRYNLGSLLLGQGQAKEAVTQLSEAARLGPENAQARLDLGEALLQANRSEEARAQFNEALRLNPSLASAHNFLGSIAGQKGLLDEAMRHYREAIRLRPDFYEAHYNLGLASVKTERFSEARKSFFEALRVDPNSVATYRRLSETFEKEQNPAQAAIYGAKANYLRGRELVRLNQAEVAQNHFREAIRLDPTLADAWYQLGTIVAGQGKSADAAQYFTEALRLDPGHLEARSRLSGSLR